ncbi:hypothetical protein SLEP1_g59126 [Rubroshorea leprosula]|uniref:Uncharacterized protein n=1 Tax=Rubroshorea leprosula TaxID=152421 RepID=A0AAV5MSI5_9ROSI|nr:hypothetical protein SLEP1_g59126 [Rubroshorea leprosula]
MEPRREFLEPSTPGFDGTQARVPRTQHAWVQRNPGIFLFGSFTEDETRSLLQKLGQKKGLQSGSFNFAVEGSLGSSKGELSRQLGPTDGRISAYSSKSQNKDDKSKKTDVNHLLLTSGTPKENGSVKSSRPVSPLSNGVKELKADTIDLTLLSLSRNEGGCLDESSSSKFHVLVDITLDAKQNGIANVSLACMVRGYNSKPARLGSMKPSSK